MTLNIRVARWGPAGDTELAGNIKANGFEDPRAGYLIQCEVIDPPSRAGRAVVLHLTEKDRDDLLGLLTGEAEREHARSSAKRRRARSGRGS